MTDQPLSDAEVRRIFTKRLRHLETMAATLEAINQNGDLCRDGQRAVNGIVDLTNELIQRIEKDEGVDQIADNIQKAVNTL